MDSGWNLIRHTNLSWIVGQSSWLGDASSRLIRVLFQYINTTSVIIDSKLLPPIFSTLSTQERRKKDIRL